MVAEVNHAESNMRYLGSKTLLLHNSGWLIDEYCTKRQFFTLDNARRIQACIDVIWGWNAAEKLAYPGDRMYVLPISLNPSMDLAGAMLIMMLTG